MKRSEFHRAVADEFGERAAFLLYDLVLETVGNRTSNEALEEGVPPREIWAALCESMNVPDARRYGVGRLEPRRR